MTSQAGFLPLPEGGLDALDSVLGFIIERPAQYPNLQLRAARLRRAAEQIFTVEDVQQDVTSKARAGDRYTTPGDWYDALARRLESTVAHEPVLVRMVDEMRVRCVCGWTADVINLADPFEPGRLAQAHLDENRADR